MGLYKNREWLFEHYIEKERSMKEIGDICSKNSQTICNWLYKLKVPVRTLCEARALSSKKYENGMRGREHTLETKLKMSEAQSGERNHFYNKKHTTEIRKKLADLKRGPVVQKICETCGKVYEGPVYKMNKYYCSFSCIDQWGERNSMWKGGISYEPYCPAFNDELKEKIRNRDNRMCQMPGCGKSEILNGKRLAVHHIDGDKMQGCDGKKWHLSTLCIVCNNRADTVENEFLIVSNSMYRFVNEE